VLSGKEGATVRQRAGNTLNPLRTRGVWRMTSATHPRLLSQYRPHHRQMARPARDVVIAPFSASAMVSVRPGAVVVAQWRADTREAMDGPRVRVVCVAPTLDQIIPFKLFVGGSCKFADAS